MNPTLLILFSAFVFAASGQEKSGIVMSNYSPVNSVYLNPSSTSDSKTYMQLRLAGVHAFASNNFVFLPSFSLPGFIGSYSVPEPVFKDIERGTGFANAAVEGPAFMISKNNFGAGIHVRARSHFNLRRVPSHIADFVMTTDDLVAGDFGAHLQNAGFSHLTWLEAGVNFSYIFIKQGDNMLQAGANLNRLWGANMMYGNIAVLEGSYRDSVFSLGIVRARFVNQPFRLFAGKGFGGDIGFTYKKMLRSVDVYLPHSQRSNCRNIPYKYKIAGSLRDIGSITFPGVTTTSLSGSGHVDIEQQGEVPQLPQIHLQQEQYVSKARAWLPFSASLQFDYNFGNGVYLGGFIVKNFIPGQAIGVQSADLLALTPRFETKNLEVCLPMMLQRYVYPHVGFAVRIRSFVIGVDNLLPLFVPTDVNTFGIYTNLSVSLFRSRKCKSTLRSVDECMPRPKGRASKREGLINRVLNRNKTYRR